MGFSEELDARDAAAKKRASALQVSEGQDQREARLLLQDFVKTARDKEIKPEKIRTVSASGTHRTSFLGWAISDLLCVGTDGELYGLAVPQGWFQDKNPRKVTPKTRFDYGHDTSLNLKDLLLQFLLRHQ